MISSRLFFNLLSFNTPYLIWCHEDSTGELDGIISIFSRRKDNAYITACAGLLLQWLVNSDEIEIDSALLCDLVGDVTNTLSGKRSTFLPNFLVIALE